MTSFSQYYIDSVLDFIYCVSHDGYGIFILNTENNINKPEYVDYYISECKKRLYRVKYLISNKYVKKYFGKDKIEFLQQLLYCLEKAGPDIIPSKEGLNIIYSVKFNEKFLEKLLYE